ncbi:MAG TPA: TetR family transcriptional regulator C-terminal domain-containing protein [Mycobacteriales bacterium]|nr:TetR family transcriptional regulator C-terminal domain-containing protein [Mycobacteriales bacterium]
MRRAEAGGATGARRRRGRPRAGVVAGALSVTLSVTLSLALALALSLAPAGTAATSRPRAGDDVTDARTRARAIAAQVVALQPRVRAARAAYDEALGGLASAVTTDVGASARLDAAEQEAAAARTRREGRMRALYKAGGPALLYASVLDARSEVVARMRSRLRGVDFGTNVRRNLTAVLTELLPLDHRRAVETRIHLAFATRAATTPALADIQRGALDEIHRALTEAFELAWGSRVSRTRCALAAHAALAAADGLALHAVSSGGWLSARRQSATLGLALDALVSVGRPGASAGGPTTGDPG